MKMGSLDSSDRIVIVAEIGNNHEGSYSRAIDLVYAAAEAGVDAVKFQTYIPELFVAASEPAALERLRKFALSFEQFLELFRLAQGLGILAFSTPLDLESARLLSGVQEVTKIASGDNNFSNLLSIALDSPGSVIVSSGLAGEAEIANIVSFFHPKVMGNAFALMHCVSSYPVRNTDANLSAISSIRLRFPEIEVGYSDHTLGIEACVQAVAYGARILEKHFTLDNQLSDFRDHQLSANPRDMASLVERVRIAEEMQGDGNLVVQECEEPVAEFARRSLYAARDIEEGEIIRLEDLDFLRPGTGIDLTMQDTVIGRPASRAVTKGQPIPLPNPREL